jgi:hypothetical protein
VIDDPANPLLIVNQRLQLKMAAQQQQQRHVAAQQLTAGSSQQPVLVLVSASGAR